MSSIDWSKSGQDKALEFIDKDMLVSASAGSGKTTVMVEKILRYLEKGDITKLLVLTFTNASAADMREKLSERLSERARVGDNSAHYKKQLSLMPFAYIGTIDSICGQIYKRYFEEIGLPPTLEVLSEEEKEALVNTALEEVFSDCIKSDNADFRAVYSIYGDARGFEKLKEPLKKILQFLSSQERPQSFLELAEQEAGKPFLETKAVKELIAVERKRYGLFENVVFEFQKELKDMGFDAKQQAKYEAKLAELDERAYVLVHSDDEIIFSTMRSGVDFKVDLPRSSKKYEPEQLDFHNRLRDFHKHFRDAYRKLRDDVFGLRGTTQEETENNLRLVKQIVNVVKLTREKYDELKREEGKCDFEDVERSALRIFENESIAEEFRNSIDYIFLDEYQDTNRLQEAIFKKISRGNLFMVGDVKQAIYGFREAEPQIFIDKRQRYLSGADGKNVPLNKNFRSEQAVLSFIDTVFSEIMSYDFGGVDYREESRFGEAGLKVNANGNSPAVEVAFFEEEKVKGDAEIKVYSVKNGERDQEPTLREDCYIAEKIAEIVGHDTLFDRRLGRERPIEYGDICILYRARKGATGLKKVFKERGIPFVAEGFEEDNLNQDVEAINCYLRVIDNPLQDVYLTGAMLSHFGGFTELELAEIRKEHLSCKYFHEAVEAYEGELKERVDAFYSKLSYYCDLSALVDVPTLVETLMTESGYLSALLAEGKLERIENYNAFVHAVRGKKMATSLRSYVDFLDSGAELKIPSAIKVSDAVTLMTIHSSKGLEFPVVFVPNMNRKFNPSRENRVVVDSRYGIGIPTFDEALGEYAGNVRSKAINLGISRKEKQEALRLMYVAFTRARYRLYVTGTGAIDDLGLMIAEGANSFMDWILFAEALNKDVKIKRFYVEEREPETEKAEEPMLAPEGAKISLKVENMTKTATETEPLSFLEYPYLEATAISNKYTVTALNVREQEDEPYIPSLETQNVEKGVAYHKVMELIDFDLDSFDEVKSFVLGLEESGEIENGVVNPAVVLKTLRHPLFEKIKKGTLLREQEFIYYAPACEVLEGVRAKDFVLVQGVMDLVAEGEENVLVDYKVSGAPVEVLRKRYRTQIELYARAYEEMTGKRLAHKAVFVLNRGEVIEF